MCARHPLSRRHRGVSVHLLGAPDSRRARDRLAGDRLRGEPEGACDGPLVGRNAAVLRQRGRDRPRLDAHELERPDHGRRRHERRYHDELERRDPLRLRARRGRATGSRRARTPSSTARRPTRARLSLPPVNQGDVATNNSNGRFFTQDPYTGGAPTWNPTTRELSLSSNKTLTLGGSNYSFCKLTMSRNSSIFVTAGATVRLYFDSPEHCGYPSGTTQLSVNSNAGSRRPADRPPTSRCSSSARPRGRRTRF